jgi:flagellar hook-associated protein 3 FlgL
MRITEANSYRNLLRDVAGIQEKMLVSQNQVSSGKKMSKPSDDPSAATDVLRLNGEKSEVAQYLRNIDSGRGRLDFADNVLDSVERMVERIRTLGILSMSDASKGPLYAVEISGLRDQIVSSANSTYQGKFIFGGSRTENPPYVVNPDQSVTYQGNSEKVKLQVSRTATLQVQIPGSDVFSGSVNIFQTATDLLSAINSGDQAAVNTQLTKLEQFHQGLGVSRARVGGLLNVSATVEGDLRDYQLVRDGELARVESANLAEALTAFTQNENALRAATAIGARISGTSILDYLT